MQRIVRDAWAWRGGFAADELRYEPVLHDASAGPLRGDLGPHWPVLTSQLEAAWSVPDADGLGIVALAGPAIAHLLLCRRAGGVHAELPRDLPELVPDFELIRGGDRGVPDWQASLRLLEDGGVIDRSAGRIALLRPEPPSAGLVRKMRDRLDDHEHEAPGHPVTSRLLRAVWEQTYQRLGGPRFRELAAQGRLRATIRARAGAVEEADGPGPLFEVGPATLPEYRNAPGAVLDHRFPERSWIGLRQVVLDPAAGRAPLWATAPEVFAAMLGAGRGANAVRRAVRGMVVWLLLAERSGGTTGPVELPTAALARALAEVLGLKPEADHRKLSRLLLADLARRGLVSAMPGPPQRIELLPVPAPDAEMVRHALAQWMTWRLQSTTEEPLETLLRLSERHRERYVRGPWIAALEERRIEVRVVDLPPGG